MLLKSHLARVTDLSIQAQAALANLPPQQIGNAHSIPDEFKAALSNRFLDYSNAYRDLFQSFERSQTAILSLPPTLSELPAIGYFTGANLVRSISVIPAERGVEKEGLGQEIADATAEALEEQLAKLNPRFVRMLRGAEQALDSDNPDRIRQFSAFRVLFMKHNSSPFKWRHFEPTIILLCVRWYCRYQLSYRDVEEMMKERGLTVDHTTVFRWVQKYAPEINKRIRPH